MSKPLRVSLAIALALLAASLGYWLTQKHTASETTEEAATSPADPGAAIISESTIRHSPGGRTAWQVRIDQMQLESGATSVAAQGVREALIYDPSGKPMIRMTADKVSGNTRSRDLEVTGNVRAVSPDGAVFDTNTIKWVQTDQKLACPGLVTMRNQDTVVRANACDFYVSQDLVKAAGKVQMTVGSNTLLGTGLTYNTKTQDFALGRVQAIFNPETVRDSLAR